MRAISFVRLLGGGALLAGISALAAEPDALARIAAQVEQSPVVRAEFVQSRQIAAMKRPLVTSGRLLFSQQHGVLWLIEQPYHIGYVLAEDRVVEIASDGSRRERGPRDVPGLAQVGRVFRAMLGTNTSALQEHFEVKAKVDAQKWELVLTPRQAQLAQFLSGMQLSGSRFVESISVSEAGGDSTQIRLRNTQGASAPTDAELQLFGTGAGKGVGAGAGGTGRP